MKFFDETSAGIKWDFVIKMLALIRNKWNYLLAGLMGWSYDVVISWIYWWVFLFIGFGNLIDFPLVPKGFFLWKFLVKSPQISPNNLNKFLVSKFHNFWEFKTHESPQSSLTYFQFFLRFLQLMNHFSFVW